jgi:hypothetical protein
MAAAAFLPLLGAMLLLMLLMLLLALRKHAAVD